MSGGDPASATPLDSRATPPPLDFGDASARSFAPANHPPPILLPRHPSREIPPDSRIIPIRVAPRPPPGFRGALRMPGPMASSPGESPAAEPRPPNRRRRQFTEPRSGRGDAIGAPGSRIAPAACTWKMVGAARFELTTPCTQNRCATRLRHAPNSASITHHDRIQNLRIPFYPTVAKKYKPARESACGRGS